MKFAASNIGWEVTDTAAVLSRLTRHDIEGLVIAPTIIFHEGPYVEQKVATEFRRIIEEDGLAIAGLQSLTFGLRGASLFGEAKQRQALTEHLKRQSELAGLLGATSLIFGSPALRQGENIVPYKAVEVFRAAAEEAANNGARLCIEPLAGYGNEFITTTVQGIELVRMIDHDGFGLHLDAAAITGSGDPLDVIDAAQKTVGIVSFDASAPELMPLTKNLTVNHHAIGQLLRENDYSGYVSLEMRPIGDVASVEKYFSEIDFMRDQYAA